MKPRKENWKRDNARRASLNLIKNDVSFFNNIVFDLDGKTRSHVMMTLVPFLSSFVVESSTWLSESITGDLDPDDQLAKQVGWAVNLLRNHRQFLERSRQRMKFLDDRVMTYLEIRSVFTQYVAAERDYFFDLHKGPLASLKHLLQTDLGLTLVNQRVAASTHALAFGFAIDELHRVVDHYRSETGNELFRDFGYQMGQYAGSLQLALDI